MVRILSDSTCDLSKDLLEKYNIAIVPLHIILGEKDYKDGLDITVDEIYQWADANNATPKTSAVSPEEAMNALSPLLAVKITETVTVIHTVVGMSFKISRKSFVFSGFESSLFLFSFSFVRRSLGESGIARSFAAFLKILRLSFPVSSPFRYFSKSE